jgi:Glyoxalase-like domain
MKVPEDKTTKNRVHIDWHAPDREAEVERPVALGASRLWDENFEWTTLADVEGNGFCVVQAEPS